MRNERETLIRKLADYILLNAFSVEHSGLYIGKAGMSLALFEASRYLNDEYIEDRAIELLKEALVTKTEDIGFENGLAGIGYVLHYLIKNSFIEADFQELFGTQYETIITAFNQLSKKTSFEQRSIRMNYFFTEMCSIYPNDKRLTRYIHDVFETIESFLLLQLGCLQNKNREESNLDVFELLETYLAVVCFCNYNNYSRPLISDLYKLYRNEPSTNQFIMIEYYLTLLDIPNFHTDRTVNSKLLSEKTSDILSMRTCLGSAQVQGKDLCLDISQHIDNIEAYILQHIPQGAFIAGYQQGISRLLCYISNPHTILL